MLSPSNMENVTSTRLRFKGEERSSRKHRRSERESPPPSTSDSYSRQRSTSRTRTRSRSRSRSKRESSRKRRRSRSRSPSDSRSSRHGSNRSKHGHSSKYKVIPAGYAPDTLSDYLFDLDDYSYHSPEAVYLREKQREKREEASYHLDQQDRQRHDDPWLRHLFDELANDDPLEYQSTLMETYTQSSTSPFPHGSSSSRINALSDSDYTSYMRRGMGRTRAEKEAQEWEEWVQEQERIKRQQSREEQRQKDERARQRRQERKERERHERDVNNDHDNTPANQLRKRKLVDMARQSYEHGWQILNEREQPLSMDMIPWPPLGGTSEEPVPQASSASKESSELLLFDFLFFGTTAGQLDVRKRLLRREQLRFHPDKFKQRFGARMATETEAAKEDEASHGSERGQILEMVERVARAFNEIGEMLQTSV